MSKIEIVYKAVKDLMPYVNNPRKNDKAVDSVAESIKEFGFKVPIVIDKNNEIIAGHTRLKAAKKLKIEEVPCIMADDLSEEQVKAYRLADNKVSEAAEWDKGLLDIEMDEILNIDMSRFGFKDDSESDYEYSVDVKIPQYEVTGDKPFISDLLDTEKADSLVKEIESAKGISKEEKEFLIQAAKRHNVFNYRNIAEYYAQSSAEMQELMEKSALVIIDYNDAIANGYTKFSKEIGELNA